jgi:ATP-dependent Clp protease ATP-binding subunit ClpB
MCYCRFSTTVVSRTRKAGQGRTVDFRNTVVIMTSNVGSQMILEKSRELDWQQIEETVRAELQRFFRPEFLNRVDDIIVFHPLDLEQLRKIVDLQLERVRKLLAERRMTLEVSDEASYAIAQEGFDPAFGARPLKRAIQRSIQNPLAMRILDGEFEDGDAIRVDRAPDGTYTFERVEAGAMIA